MPQYLNNLDDLGFELHKTGAHTSRTIMLEELETLLSLFNYEPVKKEEYSIAIIDNNCLNKKTGISRKLTFRDLVVLYGLNPSILLFRALLYFWKRDVNGRPLLALLCALARDSLLRGTVDLIEKTPVGAQLKCEDMMKHLSKIFPARYSQGTLRSISGNINSTWTKTGHLQGRSKKVRAKASPTPGSVSYALLLGYLSGAKGELLFQTEYAKALDCDIHTAMDLAVDSSRKGWIVFKQLGNVIEVLFPELIKEETRGLVNEQN